MIVKNRFTGVVISEFDIFPQASLRRANLEKVYLYGANLYGANLEVANLGGANLEGAKDEFGTLLKIITGPTCIVDSYQFTLRLYQNHEPVIFAGCRKFTFDEYYEHIKTYNNEDKTRETTHILEYLKFYT